MENHPKYKVSLPEEISSKYFEKILHNLGKTTTSEDINLTDKFLEDLINHLENNFKIE